MDEKFSSKLRILADAAKYDASCASSGAPKRSGGRTGLGSTSNGICHAYTPDGRCVSLLKILLTNYCQFDCAYCINRISSNVARARFRVSREELDEVPQYEHVKVVAAVSHAVIFPMCRAIVHHGGAGTTAAALRAGVPMLILWIGAEQPIWAAQIGRLKVGKARRFSSSSRRSLVGDLREILGISYAKRARYTATRMTKTSASVTVAADLVEKLARTATRAQNSNCSAVEVR